MTDAEKAHVASCLCSIGMVVHRDDIANVTKNGLFVRFTYGDGVWVQPGTARKIKEGLR
jgi:hypothetical protein